MVTSFHPRDPLPGSVTGQRLCEIFSHLWDFIQAEIPSDGEKPQWWTVSDYPLRPRVLWQLWQSLDDLIGVRFGQTTSYALLDIDATSPYCNADAIAEIRAALETIGIARTILIRSSNSGGMHLYIPLANALKTFDLAVALHECLKAQGFQLTNGMLEIFPNVKPYGTGGQLTNYNAHRLPLQPGTGSCLLDDALNPTGESLEYFFSLWDTAAVCQDHATLKHALKIGRDNHRKKRRLSRAPDHQAALWQADMETEIGEGWTGYGQTNHLLKTIACYGHVFLKLEGKDLVEHVLKVAIHRPGYQQYCRHQHEIERRVRAWCKAVEGYYWPIGSEPKRDTEQESPPVPSINAQRFADAHCRIEAAMKALAAQGALPLTIKRRSNAIEEYANISSKTLYRPEHKKLWHPVVLGELTEPPEDGVPSQCKTDLMTDEGIEVSAPEGAPVPEIPESLKSPETKEVYTSPEIMKCSPLSGADRKNLKKTKNKGVQGDLPPVEEEAPLLTEAQLSRLPAPPPASPAEPVMEASVISPPAFNKQQALLQEAKRLGVNVSNAKLKAAIAEHPKQLANAVAALSQQKAVEKPTQYLICALEQGWKPNKQTFPGWMQWYDQAKRLGLVQCSRRLDDVGVYKVIELGNGVPVFSEDIKDLSWVELAALCGKELLPASCG